MQTSDSEVFKFNEQSLSSEDSENITNQESRSGKDDIGNGKETTLRGKWSVFIMTLGGIIISLVCGACIAFASLFTVLAESDDIRNTEICVVCGVFATTILTPYIAIFQQELLPKTLKDTFLTLGIGVLATYASLTIQYDPGVSIGNITALLLASTPVFTLFLECILLRKACNIGDVLFTFCSVIGIFLIINFQLIIDFTDTTIQGDHGLFAFGLTLTASFSVALGHVLGRALGGRVHVITIMFFIGVTRAIVSIVLLLSIPFRIRALSSNAAGSLIGILIFSQLATWLRFNGLRLNEATTFALLANVQVVISYILDRTVFNLHVTTTDFVGAGMVLISSGLVALISTTENKKTNK